MSTALIGVSHATAPVAVRERLAVADDSALLDELLAEDWARGAMLLSTCNRTEIFVELSEGADPQQLAHWLRAYFSLDEQQLPGFSLYLLSERDALMHLCEVASGIDSQVIGEPQILGQFKEAMSSAHEQGALSVAMHGLLQRVLAIAKRVRAETSIGRDAVSIAYVAVQTAQRLFASMHKRCLLVGSGVTIERVANHLVSAGVDEIAIANRSLARARELGRKLALKVEVLSLPDIQHWLSRVDILVSSTASQLPIIGKGVVEAAFRERKHSPLLMFDLAVPRDIEPEVADLDDVYLYDLDHLQVALDEGREARLQALTPAVEIIAQGVDQMLADQQMRGTAPLLRELRSLAQTYRDRDVARAVASIRNGSDPEQVLADYGRRLSNRLLHIPTLMLREHGSRYPELLDALRQHMQQEREGGR